MELFPSSSNINFMRARHVTMAVFAALVLAAVALLVARGFNFALDFTGGAVVEVEFEKPVDVEEIRKRLAAAGVENPVVQSYGSGNDIAVRMQPPEVSDGQPVQADATRTDAFGQSGEAHVRGLPLNGARSRAGKCCGRSGAFHRRESSLLTRRARVRAHRGR